MCDNFALPARVSIRRKHFNQFGSATRSTITCRRKEHSAGTWTARDLHTPAPHQQNIVQFCRHPPSSPVNNNKMADHINLPVIAPTQLSFVTIKRTPGVTSAPEGSSSWWAARTTVSSTICVTGMTSWLMVSALESTISGYRHTDPVRRSSRKARNPAQVPYSTQTPSTRNPVGLSHQVRPLRVAVHRARRV
uniref:(northern house mosquito) hypothetical protein n=1 Tax=Culex pipiens TaxID=7175 RepID=A0A8D8D2W8_CULPI